MKLPDGAAQSFRLTGEASPLPGGQNTSVKVNDVVLKPVEDAEHTEWLLSVIDSINPKGYRLSKPVRSNRGTFVSEGWVCTRFEPGKEAAGHVYEKLKAAQRFHNDLSRISIRDFYPVNNPWAKAHQIAWQTDVWPEEVIADSAAGSMIEELLLKVKRKERYNLQLVHADLAGNILFDESLPPLIIDFSPTAAPVEYAEAILVCDCIAWQGSKVSDIELLPNDDLYNEMILRAVIFRLAVEAIFAGSDVNRFIEQYGLFKPIIDYIERR